MFKRLSLAIAALVLCVGPAAFAAPPANVSYDVGVCDPWFGTNCISPVPDAAVPINITTATTTQLIAAPTVATKRIWISSWNIIAGGAGSFTLVSGTGVNCVTSPVFLTGSYPLVANAGLVDGDGLGVVIPVGAGRAVCAITSAAVQYEGRISYTVR